MYVSTVYFYLCTDILVTSLQSGIGLLLLNLLNKSNFLFEIFNLTNISFLGQKPLRLVDCLSVPV